MDPTLIELHGENEACLVARARARLLLVLADCSALPVVGSDPTVLEGGTGTGAGDGVLRRVRDAADSILGEILQVNINTSYYLTLNSTVRFERGNRIFQTHCSNNVQGHLSFFFGIVKAAHKIKNISVIGLLKMRKDGGATHKTTENRLTSQLIVVITLSLPLSFASMCR